jgi:hypothetical protein
MYNPSRRAFLVKGAVATGGVLVGGSLAGCGSGSGVGTLAGSTTSTFPHVTTGDQGLARLMAGNARFLTSSPRINPGDS